MIVLFKGWGDFQVPFWFWERIKFQVEMKSYHDGFNTQDGWSEFEEIIEKSFAEGTMSSADLFGTRDWSFRMVTILIVCFFIPH